MAEWYCSPTGLVGNLGSTKASPWDIASAASGHSGAIQPGDVVWWLGPLAALTDTQTNFTVSGALGTGVDNIDQKIIFRAYNPTVVGVPTSKWIVNGKSTADGTGDPTKADLAGIQITNTSAASTATGLTVNGVNGNGSTTVSVSASGGSGQAVAVGHGLTIASGPAAGWYMINGATTVANPGPTTVTITPGLRGATAGGEGVTLTLGPSGVDCTSVQGSYLWFWNLNIWQILSLRSANTYAGAGFSNFGQANVGLKFIYNDIHDVAGSPFFIERTCGRTELYGNRTQNTGGTGTGDGGGHDYYQHHNDLNGNRLRIEAALMLNGFTPHFQAYDAHGDPVNNIDIVNNISLGSGANSTDPNLGSSNAICYILGGTTAGLLSNITCTGNFGLQADGNGDVAIDLGSAAGLGTTISIQSNYFNIGGTGFGAFRQRNSVNSNGSLDHRFNTYRVRRSDATHNGYVYRVPNNTPVNTTWGSNQIWRTFGAGGNACGNELPSGPAFIGVDGTGGCRTLAQFQTDTGLTNDTIQQDPTQTQVYLVKANKYEAGRAHIVIDNFAGLSQIPVDLSPILNQGDTYIVQDIRNWNAGVKGQAGSPVIGPIVYNGGTVNFPNTQIADPAVSGGHAGVGQEIAPPATAPQRNVFIVIRTIPYSNPVSSGGAQTGGKGSGSIKNNSRNSRRISARGGRAVLNSQAPRNLRSHQTNPELYDQQAQAKQILLSKARKLQLKKRGKKRV